MTNEAANPEDQVEKMFEYGYRKSNYGPDELVTDAHGNPISVVDAMLSAKDAGQGGNPPRRTCATTLRAFLATRAPRSACAP